MASVHTLTEIAQGYLRSLRRPNLTLIVAIALITLITLSPITHKEYAEVVIPAYLVANAAILLITSLIDYSSRNSEDPFRTLRPRNNAIYITAGNWPSEELRYRGGKVQQVVLLELLLSADVICVHLDEYIIGELSRLTSVLPTTWSRVDYQPHYKRGDWVIVVHGDPGLEPTGVGAHPAVELQTLSKQSFWLELVIIDHPPAPLG